MDDNLKKELLDQLNAELGVKQGSKDARFDSSTGTLYANDLKNYPVKCVNGRIWVNNHAHVLQSKPEMADNKV